MKVKIIKFFIQYSNAINLFAKNILLFIVYFSIAHFATAQDKQTCGKLINIGGKYYVETNGIIHLADTSVVTVKLRNELEKTNIELDLIRANKLGFMDIAVPVGVNLEKFVSMLKSSDDFEYIDYNGFGRLYFTPNDSLLNKQWHLSFVKAFEAWLITTGSSLVKVAILDSGLDWMHQDIGMGSDGYKNVDESLGWNYTDSIGNVITAYPHGTRVSGVLGAKTNNTTGIAGISGGGGISSGVTVIPMVICKEFTNSDLVDDAIIDAVDKGARVINMSFGAVETQAINSAIEYALQNNVVLVAAAGNMQSPKPEPVVYPARHPGVIAVGSVGQDTLRSQLYGPELDISAPGVDIWTTNVYNDYGGYSGTSFAAPIVSGIAALALSVNPNLSSQQIRGIIESTAQKVGGYNYQTSSGRPNGTWNEEIGYGLVNAHATLLATLETRCYSSLPIINETITQNTNWNTPKNVNGIVTITNGMTFKITSVINFDDITKIIIHPGGKLIVDGGTLTNACIGEMWGGITVMGDPTKPLQQQYQGFVQVVNHGKIENAVCGITVQGGGMVEATNADFVNNTTQIKFEPVEKGQTGTSGTFTHTNFEINSGYIGNQANFAGHLLMDNCGNVLVKGSTFTSPVSTQANAGIIVSNLTKWSGTNQLFSVPVEIRPGGTLTNTDIIANNEKTTITVHPGGKIVASGGGTFTNIGNKLWQGITVVGDPTLPPIQSYQGYIQIVSNGKIENAQCGITVKGGGLVSVSDAHFENNTIGVFFDRNAGGGTFTQTNFILDDSYLGETGSGANGDKRDFVAHLKMRNSNEVNVKGCTFSSTAPFYLDYKNRGIEAINTNLVLKEYCPLNALIDPQTGFCDTNAMTRNNFSGFSYAIHSSNAGTLPKLKVRFSLFSGNYIGGIYTIAQNYSELIKNEFIIDKTFSYGLSVEHATGYKIEENICRNLSPVPNLQNIGLRVTNSWSDENEVYKNEYHNLDIAQQFLGKNSSQTDTLSGPGGPHELRGNPVTGLQTLCNDFSNSQSMDILVGDWNNPNPNNNLNSIRDKQGNSQLSAGNKFNNNNPPINIDNRLSQHAIDYYWSIPVEKPNSVAGTVSQNRISNTNRCPSKLGTLIIHNREGGSIEDLELAFAQYDEWNAEYEYWFAKLLACKGNNGEECNMIYDKVSYLSGLKNNFFNSIIVWAFGKDKVENDIDAETSIIETLRFLFTYRGSYSDYLSLTETYLAENNYDAALTTIAKMYEQFKVTEEQFSELKGLEKYTRWLQKLQEEQNNIYELSEKEIDYLVNFVKSNTGRGVVFAKNILCFVYNICLETEIIRGFEDEKMRRLDDEMIAKSLSNIEGVDGEAGRGSLFENITLVPNPTTGELTITSYELQINNVEIYDVYGKKQNVEFNSYGLTVLRSYGLSNLSAGIYFVRIKAEGGVVVKKVIKN